ncbi:hypothetical protein PF008_g8600 [Phytophthora fragariae]|nr:hypothetical protein PF008_g8600 [Phytophthora fragariae]
MLVNAIKLWLCEALLVFTYPAYYYIYTTLSKAGKTSFALLLPVIKLVMKNIIARSVIHLKDEMPEVVVFNVEVFNALFLSYCMLNSPSVWVTLEIMIFDGFMMAFALRDVGNARRCLKELERRIEHESSWDSFRNRGSLSSKSLSARLTTLDRAGLILLSNDIKPKTTSTRSSEAPNAILVSTSLRPAPCLAKSSVKVIAKSFDSIRRLSAERLFGRGRVHPEVNNGGSSPTRYSDKVQRLLYAVEFLLLMNYVEVIIPLV